MNYLNIMLPLAQTTEKLGGSGLENINFTLLFSVISISIAAMVAFIRIFGRKELTAADKPCEDNQFCAQHIKEINRVDSKVTTGEISTAEIKSTIIELKITIAELKKDVASSNRTIDEIKTDNRALAARLENLLTQLLAYVSD